jgi:hypothetical protein
MGDARVHLDLKVNDEKASETNLSTQPCSQVRRHEITEIKYIN